MVGGEVVAVEFVIVFGVERVVPAPCRGREVVRGRPFPRTQ